MGRTNPTYRDALGRLEEEYQPFRRGLRWQYRADFDELFEHAREFADAAGYQNHADAELAFFASVLLGHQVALRHLRARVAELEAAAGGDGTPGDDGATVTDDAGDSA